MIIHPRGAAATLGALALALVLGACAPAGAGTPTTVVPFVNAVPGPEVTVAVAAQLEGAGAFVLDVREPDEFAAGHIFGATLIPLGQLPTRLGDVPHNRAVVVVCRTGHRSAQGRDILLGAGYTEVTSMTGGMTEWVATGHTIVTGT